MENKLDKIIESIDQLARMTFERFEKVDEKFEEIDKKFEKVDERFDIVDRKLDGLRNQIDNIALTRARVEIITSLESRVIRLEEKVFEN